MIWANFYILIFKVNRFMNKKQWILYAFCIVSILNIAVFFLMMWSDTYSNIHPTRKYFFTEPNTRVSRVDYILKNPTKYDSFIFGSSRVGAIDPLLIHNGIYYNMTYSEGIPHEHLINIKLFLKSGIKIKNLLIGLGSISYQVSFNKHQKQGLTKAHRLATNTNIFIYYRELFLRFPSAEDRHHITKKIFGGNRVYMDISKQEERYKKQEATFSIEQFMTKEHMNDPVFNKPALYNGDFLDETMADIRDMKNICTNRHIKCIFFINPIHHKMYEFINKKLFYKFKLELSKITDYYDFSEQNYITNNNCYWGDTLHYNREVADMIIQKIYRNKNDKFGVYITKGSK